MHIIASLMMLLSTLHLTAIEPIIRDAVAVARNPVIRKDVKAAVQVVQGYEKAQAKNPRNANRKRQ